MKLDNKNFWANQVARVWELGNERQKNFRNTSKNQARLKITVNTDEMRYWFVGFLWIL